MITATGVIVFSIIFVFLILFTIRKHSSALSRSEAALAFLFKVALGCLYGYLFITFYEGDDTWAIHAASIKEWELLKEDPLQFFWEFTPGTAMRNGRDFWQTGAFYISDLEYCLQTKTLGLFNVISRGNYYINSVFFNFTVFWGHYWLFLLAIKYFPGRRRILFLCIFFLPTAVFWLSGIRGDGMLFFFFSLLMLSFDRFLDSNKPGAALLSLVGFAGMIIFRTPVAFLLLPALVSWWLIRRADKHPVIAFAAVYGISILLFFASSVVTGLNGPQAVANRQAEYLLLKGNTRYELPVLQADVAGFVSVFPYAFYNTFLRPTPWEAKGMLQLASAAGVVLFWVIVVYSLVRRKPVTGPGSAFLWMLLLFGLTLYLLIGYTVPFPGAIVRYKSIGEMVVLVALIGGLAKFPTFRRI